jgi:hypothetical protein
MADPLKWHDDNADDTPWVRSQQRLAESFHSKVVSKQHYFLVSAAVISEFSGL